MDTSRLFIISGPSGSGQDSIIEGLSRFFTLERVITTTSRPLRPTESEGHPYHFLSRPEFARQIAANHFVEWAQTYNGEYYGVARSELERVCASGHIGIWKIDWQGVRQAKKLFPSIKAILIYAERDIMAARIEKRDHPTPQHIAERMHYTEGYFAHQNIYDFQIHNQEGELERAVHEVARFIQATLPPS